MATDTDLAREQLAVATRLQLKWLQRMETMLDAGDISPTDMSTLERFLRNNGWTLDPRHLPKGIQELLTSQISPEDLDEDDLVVGSISRRA